MKIVYCIFSLLFILTATVRITYGQSIAELVVPNSNFNESFDSSVPVSGSTIVGVLLGEPRGNVAIADTQLALVTDTNICVRIVTQDGRFSASNIYKLTSPLSDVGSVRLSPVTMNYAEALSEYKAEDFAVSAFAAHEGACRPSETAFLPQLASTQPPWHYLTVIINSGARYSFLVVDKHQQKVRCQRISEGPLIAYDQKCSVDVDLLEEGSNDFTLVLDDGFGEEEVRFKVMMPLGQ